MGSQQRKVGGVDWRRRRLLSVNRHSKWQENRHLGGPQRKELKVQGTERFVVRRKEEKGQGVYRVSAQHRPTSQAGVAVGAQEEVQKGVAGRGGATLERAIQILFQKMLTRLLVRRVLLSRFRRSGST